MNLESVLFATIIGIMGGLLGVFYRNCLKPKNMIFNALFDTFSRWVETARRHEKAPPHACSSQKPSAWQLFLGNWAAYILGYCVYCATTWITGGLYLIISGFNIWILLALGVQHLVVVVYCRVLIDGNEDLQYGRRVKH